MMALDQAIVNFLDDLISLDMLVREVTRQWNTITNDAPGGRKAQLEMYRQSIGLPPPDDALLCEEFNINCELDIIAIISAVSVLGGLLIVVVSCRVIIFIKQGLDARRKQERRQQQRLLEAVEITKKLNFPCHLIRSKDFLAAGSLIQHERLRDQ